MSNQYERLLKLRRQRDLQKTLQANQLLEQLRATEHIETSTGSADKKEQDILETGSITLAANQPPDEKK